MDTTKLIFGALFMMCWTLASQAQHNSTHHENNTFTNKKSHQMRIEEPKRISYTFEQTIEGTFEEIMPLYCPVREIDWCENWQPIRIISYSGLVEKDCIFMTPHNDKNDVFWIVTQYDLEAGEVEMLHHIPGVLVTRLNIRLTANTENKTKASITYAKTSLSESGDKVLTSFTKENYDIMMDSWEQAMNHYLKTGEMLRGLPNF